MKNHQRYNALCLFQSIYKIFEGLTLYIILIIKTKHMISKEGDYYVCQGEAQAQVEKRQVAEVQEKELEAKGDIKERLAHMKNRVEALKNEKKQLTATQKTQRLSEIYHQPSVEPANFSLSLSIPDEILEIEQRVSRLEEKILGYEIHKQRTEKKGVVVQRVKTLQKKLQDMLKVKSIETITNSIIQYSTNLDEREEYMKQLFLYEVYTKTQGLTEELNVLEGYLQNLSNIQRIVNSAVPVSTLVKSHNEILTRAEAMRARTEKMFKQMKGEYQKLLDEIDAIEV